MYRWSAGVKLPFLFFAIALESQQMIALRLLLVLLADPILQVIPKDRERERGGGVGWMSLVYHSTWKWKR